MTDEEHKELVDETDGNQLSVRIGIIWRAAQDQTARTVNANLVCAYWLIGRELVEEEQNGSARATYGKKLLVAISGKLTQSHGRSWSVRSLEYARAFYLAYPALLDLEKSNAVRSILLDESAGNSNAVRSISQAHNPPGLFSFVGFFPSSLENWSSGQLHPSLSWTHYRFLSRIQDAVCAGVKAGLFAGMFYVPDRRDDSVFKLTDEGYCCAVR